MTVGLRKREKAQEKKNSDKVGSISSTLEFKLIPKCLWQLENKLSDEKKIKTLHEENWMLPSPKKQDKEPEKRARNNPEGQTDTNGLLPIRFPKFKIQFPQMAE